EHNFLSGGDPMDLENVLGQINADCGNLHGVAPLISSLRQLHYDALRRPLEQEPSTPSAFRPSWQYFQLQQGCA
ncbi:hypothetical protein J7394_22025, partial [Ruegeria sp. R13_0]|uniref:hypothetical protein n=1 Tax=Ruegeria sp. R13_0 TaxID=2821099 RepID=UPI001AD9C9C4